MRPLITLTTDFGGGSYVAQVRGVILSLLPEARVEDIWHGVAPGDVLEAAYVLEVAVPAFAEGSVHVAVVDPGVGTERKGIVVAFAGRILVGPDNGIFTAFLPLADDVRVIENADLLLPEISGTFHGRDVFAPVAAHLAGGVPLGTVGPAFEGEPVLLSDLEASENVGEEDEAAESEGVVLHVDRFGNLVTAFRGGPEEGDVVEGPERSVRERAVTFGEAPEGEPFLYAGSGGRLEVGVRGGSAATALSWSRGTALKLKREKT